MCGETSRMDGDWRDNICGKKKEMGRGAVFGKDREVEATTVRNEKVENIISTHPTHSSGIYKHGIQSVTITYSPQSAFEEHSY